jgi:hypothetical protein
MAVNAHGIIFAYVIELNVMFWVFLENREGVGADFSG